MKTWKLMILLLVSCLLTGCSLFGASEQKKDYDRCNVTSRFGELAETEAGFFYRKGSILYYADKTDLSTWVPVCNKPDCMHESGDRFCNAYVDREKIVQHDGKIYYIDHDLCIFEIAQDGSGSKLVYEVKTGFDDKAGMGDLSYWLSFTPEKLLLHYCYLKEDGYFEERIVRLDENDDTLHTLYSATLESQTSEMLTSVFYWLGVRGKDMYLSSNFTEDEENTLNTFWDLSGDVPESISIPPELTKLDEYLLFGSYLSEDALTYYKEGEGFYEYDLETGEHTLIYECFAENGWGTVFSEDCIMEYYMTRNEETPSKELYFRVYNGKEWISVALPNAVKNASNTSVGVLAIASDRIICQDYTKKEEEGFGLAYVLLESLEEGNPELVFFNPTASEDIDTTKESVEQETKEPITEEIGITDFRAIDEITVFDNEYCLLKVTGFGMKKGDTDYTVELYWENKTSKSYEIDIALKFNGLLVDSSDYISSDWTKDGTYRCVMEDWVLQTSGILYFYEDGYKQFTDIEVVFNLEEETASESDSTEIMESVHLYPLGEEQAQTFVLNTEEAEHVIVDNEELTICVMEYEQNAIPYDKLVLCVQNKTDQYISIGRVGVEDVSINHVVPSSTFSGAISAKGGIAPGSCGIYVQSLCYDGFLENYNITEIGTIQLFINAYYTNYKGDEVGETIFSEIATIYPQGEEQAQTFVREPKDTDIILIDNAYVKVVSSLEENISETLYRGYPYKSVPLYVTNKTDEVLTFKREAEAINGYMTGYDNNEINILPHTTLLTNTGYFSSEIATGDKREVLLRVYPYGGGKLGEDLVVEKVPIVTGEDVEPIVREAQDTDLVLIDNEYMKVTATHLITYDNMPPNFATLHVINKTDTDMMFYITDILLNGEITTDENEKCYIFANGCIDTQANIAIDASEGTLESVKCLLKAHYLDYGKGIESENLLEQEVSFKTNELPEVKR